MNKRIINIFLTLAMCVSMCIPTLATSSYIDPVHPFIEEDYGGSVMDVVEEVLGHTQFITWGIAVGMMIYVGIKYMMSAANERANLKNGTINFVIGAIVIAAANTLFYIIVDIVQQATTTTT